MVTVAPARVDELPAVIALSGAAIAISQPRRISLKLLPAISGPLRSNSEATLPNTT